MSEPIFFEWVEVEAFRGFQAAQRFDFGSSVVLITGPNGTGKTSLFDALQWLLVGTIERLEPWRVRRNSEHIVNRWRAESNGLAAVSAGVRVAGANVELRRTGRHDGSLLEWHDETRVLRGQDAEDALTSTLVPAGRTSLRRSLLRSGLLQQDVIRDVLEDKPAERYEQLSAILGLDAIAEFPAAARARATALTAEGERARTRLLEAEARLTKQREQIQHLRATAAALPPISQARTDIGTRVDLLAEVVRLRAELPVSSAEAESIRAEVAQLGQILSTSLQTHDGRWAEAIASQRPTAEELVAAEGAKAGADASVALASEALVSANSRCETEREVTARLTRLAIEAMPLLGDSCPVCEQDIDPEHVKVHLQQLVDGDSGALAKLTAERSVADAGLSEAQRAAAMADESYNALRKAAESYERAAEARTAWLKELASGLSRQAGAIELRAIERITNGDLEAISSAVESLRSLWAALGELAAVLSSSRESARLSTGEAEASALEFQVNDAREHAVRASAAEEEGKTLQRAAVRAATSVTDRRFARLKPIIQDIYARLDPHPAFTDLLFAVDVYRERSIASPQVSDPESGVAADPLLIFSSAQANVVALSAFLALGWAAREDAMPFLLLDDPLQSLDDVNALGFADLCRHIRTRRQLVVSTHDKRLAALLERKLAPRRDGDRTALFRFNAWSRNGPDVDRYDIPSQADDSVRHALLSDAA